MNRLSIEERAKILSCLVEGNSIRSTARITNTDKKTVLRLLADVGAACKAFHDEHVRNIKAELIQTDEAWQFCYAKEANVPEDFKGEFGFGDVWTWTAIDAKSKLIVSYRVDRRDSQAANAFVRDVKDRLANRVQLTSDGYRPYFNAVGEAFGSEVDYAMLVKMYHSDGSKESARRYSSGKFTGSRRVKVTGNPNRKDISTSYVERQNLTMRMSMRRFTRLTNAFSKKVENHMHAVSLHFLFYNFARIHQTLRVTPAMEAGISDHVWSMEDIAKLAEPKPIERISMPEIVG